MEETTNYGLKLIEDSDDYTDIFDDHNDSMEIIDTELAKKLESVPVMTGSTALTDGTEGLAPKPLAGETNRFLRADGTWTVPAGSGDSQVGIYTIDATIPVSSWVAGTNDYSVTISDQTIISTMTVIEWGITNETEANPLMLGETNVTVGAGTLTITTDVIPVASWTVHIDLGTDGSNVLNEVAGKADQELLGYREDGNTASRTIADGSFVVWKGSLYKANGSIPQGTAFSSSNLTEVTSGGLNELQSDVESLSDRIKNIDYYTLINAENITPTLTTITLYQGRSLENYKYALAIVKRGTYYRATMLIPVALIYASGNISLTEVDSSNTQRWYEIKYVNPTTVTIQSSSNVSDATVWLYGVN